MEKVEKKVEELDKKIKELEKMERGLINLLDRFESINEDFALNIQRMERSYGEI